ncbi:hypothetical protein KIL84_014548 [Mauremys mutica]|uniref:Uncharacterized protein n=1 Tax=Mauremys mutica TaxID=74926 RepID=A0A9D3XQE9_9SAUR|nr:hypothetical protein KIL84_014548 [Mauremys mutica]
MKLCPSMYLAIQPNSQGNSVRGAFSSRPIVLKHISHRKMQAPLPGNNGQVNRISWLCFHIHTQRGPSAEREISLLRSILPHFPRIPQRACRHPAGFQRVSRKQVEYGSLHWIMQLQVPTIHGFACMEWIPTESIG